MSFLPQWNPRAARQATEAIAVRGLRVSSPSRAFDGRSPGQISFDVAAPSTVAQLKSLLPLPLLLLLLPKPASPRSLAPLPSLVPVPSLVPLQLLPLPPSLPVMRL